MKTIFPHLFSPTTLGPLTLKNRIVRSATYDAKVNKNGRPTEQYLRFFQTLAKGGAGLIVTGLMYPEPCGKLPKSVAVDSEECVAHISRIPAAVKEVASDCKMALQIGHIGRQLPHTLDIETVAPSAILEPHTGTMPREITVEEIESFIEKSAAAINYAKQAGFDAVQVHAAHGWLLSSFLSPHTNHRNDQYGGSTENRARIVTEIIGRARQFVDDDFPVFVKMNANDFVETGIELPEALQLGELFENAGYSAMEVSSGMWETITRDPDVIGWKAEPITEARKRIKTVDDEAYHREFARAFRQRLKKAKVILIGGLKTPALMDDIIASNDADLVSLSRALIREPDLPNRWRNGSRKKAACISCNNCIETLEEDDGLRCPNL